MLYDELLEFQLSAGEEIDRDQKMTLYESIDKLSPKFKTVVILRFFEDMKFEDAINLAGKVLKENLEQKINKDNVQISYIKNSEKKIVSLTPDEIEKLIPNF